MIIMPLQIDIEGDELNALQGLGAYWDRVRQIVAGLMFIMIRILNMHSNPLVA